MKARRIVREFGTLAVLLTVLVSTPIIIKAQSITVSSRVSHMDDRDEVLRVDTNLVSIPTIVRDREGRYITDLKKEDFQIFEDGVRQDVAFFEHVEKPFTILFLLDTSSSMTPYMKELTHAANAFVSQLRPDDRLSAISFDDWVKVLFQITKVSELRKDIKLRPGNSTWLYDAVDYALKHLKKVQGRKAIVLFSDGVDSRAFATPKSNLRAAEEEDTVIYTVQFNASFWSPAAHDEKVFRKSLEIAKNYMMDLAQKTGGRYYPVENISDLSKTFGLVADELRQQYSLGYYPKKSLEAGQKRRQIKVKVDLPNLAVRARDSYLFESSKKIQ